MPQIGSEHGQVFVVVDFAPLICLELRSIL
jgi:hypothetical protein